MAEAKEEPSIEEILGSIRRIIAEDDGGTPKEAAAAAPVEAAPMNGHDAEEEPLELTNKIEAAPAPAVVQEEEKIDLSFADITLSTEPLAPSTETKQETSFMTDNQDAIDNLLSDTTANATAAVMSQLARHTAITEEGHDGITVENIVRELLKPMLRNWLDMNLPSMVEKMVARELDRLSKRI